MKKLPYLLALALLGACSNPTTSADDTDKGQAAAGQDLSSAPPPSTDSTAATPVTGSVDSRGVDATTADSRPPEDPAQPGAAVTPDANFASSALADGQFEVQMAQRLLKDKGVADASLRTFAQQMVTDHTKAGDELHRVVAALQMNVTDRLNRDQIAVLSEMDKRTGKPLQTLYLEWADKGHAQAVNLFKTASQSAQKPELRQFATKYLPTIEHHAAMAKALHAGKPMAM